MGFSESVIIFHPGSCHLYVGRASDPQPVCIRHVIARKVKAGGARRIDKLFPYPEVPADLGKVKIDREKILKAVQEGIMMASSGEEEGEGGAVKEDLEDVAEFNNMIGKTTVKEEKGKVVGEKEFFVGDEVLVGYLAGYNVHCPWRRGQMNVGEGVGRSVTAVVQDLEDIWRWSLLSKLGVKEGDLKDFRAVVVVPVLFDRLHARHLMSMIVNSLGFQSCFFIQDHVCASFGAGLSTCTVLDLGDQKISVSCVEDGVSYPQSRIELKFGGGDLSVALWNQLELTSFPVQLDMHSQCDWELVSKLKETNCHLDFSSWKGPVQASLQGLPSSTAAKLGAELVITPTSLFYPETLHSLEKPFFVSYSPPKSVTDDPHDSDFLAETLKRPKIVTNEASSSHPSQSGKKQDIPLFGIDAAIAQSIKLCGTSEDLEVRLFSSIICTGGSAKLPGLSSTLSHRLSRLSSKLFPPSGSQGSPPTPNVVSLKTLSGADEDPAVLTWQGAAILSSLDTAKDLWISRQEWNTSGSKLLREKSLFHY